MAAQMKASRAVSALIPPSSTERRAIGRSPALLRPADDGALAASRTDVTGRSPYHLRRARYDAEVGRPERWFCEEPFRVIVVSCCSAAKSSLLRDSFLGTCLVHA